MKKKMLIICLAIMLVLPSAVFAGGFLGLQVGPAAILNEPIDLDTVDPDYFTNLGPEDFGLGIDIRANVSIAEVGAVMNVGYDSVWQEVWFDGMVGAGLSLELLGLVDLGVTAGPWIVGFADSTGVYTILDEIPIEMLPVLFRPTVTVNLGGISAGLWAIMDSGLTVGALMDGVLPDPSTVNTTAKVGMSVLLNLL